MTEGRASNAETWREPILRNFSPEIAAATRLTIVADPDQLLTEQEILAALKDRGFDLVPFEDHVAFRYAYESRYRQIWDRGETTNLVVVLRSPSGDLAALPYDLVEQAEHQGRCFRFSVSDLFPKLNPNVVLSLDRSHFDALHTAQVSFETPKMGLDASRDFVLRHVFRVAPELITRDSDLLQVLLRRHYRGEDFPPDLDSHFVKVLRKNDKWSEWPLEEIIPSRAAFLGFLDERWPLFVAKETGGDCESVGEDVCAYGLRFSGPANLPFGHDDVKVYIDNLFQEGGLTPIEGVEASALPSPWMQVGIASPSHDELDERARRLFGRLDDELPGTDAEHRDWVHYAQTWAEWSSLRWRTGADESDGSGPDDLHDKIEERFSEWMTGRFAALHNLSPVMRPAMVHHIAQHIAHHFVATGAQAAGEGPPKKYALLVVDGLAVDQWVTLREVLSDQLGHAASFDEDGSFAWVPTLTGVSRQAIFAGVAPMFFAKSLGSTAKEPALWTRFWEDRGAKRNEIGYVKEGKGQEDATFLQEVVKVAEHPKMRILGVVVNKVDQAMHGNVFGTRGMHDSIRGWAQSGAMEKLLRRLLDLDFEICLTADHGNIQGHGIGKPNVGVTADERGERAHRFSDLRIRSQVAEEFPGSIEWPPIGLPEEWQVLLAPGRGAFVPEGKHVVGHGGIAMEEVIVPFVKIRRGDR